MKITKYPQSCIMVESLGTKILIDPGKTKFEEKFLKDWAKADAILVTHGHGDHYNKDEIKKLDIPIYSTKEVQESDLSIKIHTIKQGDEFLLGKIKVEVVKAIHGYMLPAGEIKENVGFVLDDGKTRLYVTSDSIRFKTDIKADVMFADITAFDASMNLWGATATMNDVGARLLIVAHQDEGKMLYDKSLINDYLTSQNINFIVPPIGQIFEI